MLKHAEAGVGLGRRPCVEVEKNSLNETSPKKPIVGVSSEITIAVVVTTEITAQAASRPLITDSP